MPDRPRPRSGCRAAGDGSVRAARLATAEHDGEAIEMLDKLVPLSGSAPHPSHRVSASMVALASRRCGRRVSQTAFLNSRATSFGHTRRQRRRPHTRTGLGKLAMFVVLLAHGQVGLAQVQHGLPFVNAAGSAQTGFVWIINRSSSAGTVEISAIDDSGERSGPVDLSLDAMAAVRLSSSELEGGNADKGLPVGIGDGEDDWRLELTTELDIDALAFIRTADGFVTAGHDVVQPEFVPASSPGGDDSILYHVSFFNPGSNTEQQSLLRLM